MPPSQRFALGPKQHSAKSWNCLPNVALIGMQNADWVEEVPTRRGCNQPSVVPGLPVTFAEWVTASVKG